MVLYDNAHKPTAAISQRIKDLAIAGIPKYLIAKIVRLDEDTVTKYYSAEFETAQAEAVMRIGQVVARQAEEGDSKAQALYLKTQGAKFGWIEKQILENVSSDETKELREQIKALEEKYQRDYYMCIYNPTSIYI